MPDSADDFRPGQRWISESEPELGLGAVRRVTVRTVTLEFGGGAATREYSRSNAPLRRVQFRVGATISNRKDSTLVVQAVTERNGLFFYRAGRKELCETDLSDALSFDKPEERLLAGHWDRLQDFDLRVAALEQQYRRRSSKVRGFAGGRIDLIPHQLYIASEVAGRLAPRVLLADEVGLGKTIEACLILHRLILTGRAQRALILAPDSLIHQWFVELLRRFNLWFSIFDEQRCQAIEGASPGDNPFLDSQFVLCGISVFITNPDRTEQALAAGWDILVVDEAHHLGWAPEGASPEYRLVEALGLQTPSLLLLTATPQQLGIASHFARLRLLDPNRFYDLQQFVDEAESYRVVARLAQALLNDRPLGEDDVQMLAHILVSEPGRIRSLLKKMDQGGRGVREELISALLDQHGTGRVTFRNTRETIAGFPLRHARLHPLDAPPESQLLFDNLAEECASDTDSIAAAYEMTATPEDLPDIDSPDFSQDPRIPWLANLLRILEKEKALLICRSQSKVIAIEAALRQRISMKFAVFHEGLSLIQRDRNAAWFAEPSGTRLLISSEIGSEGRNFQFVHHLVLFDLPLDPEVLEQRIGRLDRIGQTSAIQVHVPYVTGSCQEALARWYHEGLNAFEKNLHGGREILERFGLRVYDMTQNFHDSARTSRFELEILIQDTKSARTDIAALLHQGRDRLLELNSYRPDAAARLIQQIRLQDDDASLQEFLLAVFERYSIQVEDIAYRTFRLGSAGVLVDSFPGLPAEGMTITSDRKRALVREDVQFLTPDHPLVTGALDLLLGSERGNSSFAMWVDSATVDLYLEAIYLLECIAPAHVHIDRFLPPTPLRVLVDRRGVDAGNSIDRQTLERHLKDADTGAAAAGQSQLREAPVAELLERTQVIATSRVPEIIAQARMSMTAQLDLEIARLKELKRVNRSVRTEEIGLLVEQRRALDEHLSHARLRLEAARLIQRGPLT